MKRGHVVGTKKEKKGASDWYKAIEQANLDHIMQTWAAFAQAEAAALDQIVSDIQAVSTHALNGYRAYMEQAQGQ